MKKIGPMVCALLLAAVGLTGAAAATPDSSAAAHEIDDVDVIDGGRPGARPATADDVGIQFANSDCATLTSPGGARAEVCKTWQTESDGFGWFGAVSIRVFGATFIQARALWEDGQTTTYPYPDERPDDFLLYKNMAAFHVQACNSISKDCGAWW